MIPGTEAVSLDDLPDHVVSNVLMLLPGEALATLAVQNRQLRRFTATQSLWRNCCCCRWPYMEEFCPRTGLDWRSVYRDRHSLPSTFWSKAGLLMQTARQKSGHNAASAETWQAFYAAGLEAVRLPLLGSTWEHKALCEAAGHMLQASPQMLTEWLNETTSMAQDFDFWGSGFTHWAEIPWRRSAAEFFVGFLRAHDITMAEKDALQEIDESIKSIDQEAENLAMVVPKGMPRQHFWWFLKGANVKAWSSGC